MSVDAALLPLAPYRTGNWILSENAGWYVHRGRVYLQGEINAWGQAGITAAILTGLPAGIRPALDQALTLYADIAETEDTVNPALALPLAYAATLRTDGSLSLDAPPPAGVTATPPGTYVDGAGTHPRYTSPFLLGIALAGVSWPVDPATDTYTPVSFAPYLGPDFTDVDATIVAHDARAHLDGHVTATVDGAYRLATSLPDSCVPAGPDADGQYGVIVARDPRYHRVGELTTHSITFTNDPPPDSPAHHWGDPLTFPGLFNGDLGDRPAGSTGYTNIFQVGLAAEGGSDTWGGGATYSCPLYSVTCVILDTIECAPLLDGSGGPTGPFSGGASGSVAALVANYDPAPDWLIVSASVSAGANGGVHGCLPCIDPESGWTGGGCQGDQAGASVAVSAPGGLVDAAGNPVASSATGPSTGGSTNALVNGYVAQGAPSYAAAPDDPRSILLWRPSEISSVDFAWSGVAANGGAEWSLAIQPFWERRDVYFRAGDVLDLTGCGWQLLRSAAVTPSTIAAGLPASGLLRPPPVLGAAAPGARTPAPVVGVGVGAAGRVGAGASTTGLVAAHRP